MQQIIFYFKLFFKSLLIYFFLLILIAIIFVFSFKSAFKQHYIIQYKNYLDILVNSINSNFSIEHINQSWCKNIHEDFNKLYPTNNIISVELLKNDKHIIICSFLELKTNRSNIEQKLQQRSDINIPYHFNTDSDTNIQEKVLYITYPTKNPEYSLRIKLNLKDLEFTINIINQVLYILIPIFIIFILFVFILFLQKTNHKFYQALQKTFHSFNIYNPNLKNNDFVYNLESIDIILHKIHSTFNDKYQELKKQLEEQRTILSSISEAVLAIDTKEAPLFYNSKFAILFEINKFKKFNRIVEIIRNPQILNIFRNTLYKGQAIEESAITVKINNKKHFIALSTSPLKTPSNKIYGCVGIFYDVTELKKTEQIKTDFVANVSHELRTPLTTIKGYTDTIIEDLNNNKPISKDLVLPIAANTQRLINIVNDLLSLSAVELSDELLKETIDTKEITNHILYTLDSQITTKSHKIETIIKHSYVHANKHQLEQVLFNLIDNACKYTQKNGCITITWEDDDKNVYLSVKDNGPGIPDADQQRIFERFYRVDKSRSRNLGGTGLGLAIVKHIMINHNGNIKLNSKVNKGTEFICTFPKI